MKLIWSLTFMSHCYFTKLNLKKNGASLILPSCTARNSSAPNAKIIFEILWGILEGRINSAWPSRPCLKNCQNGTFWSVHGIWKFFGPNDFIWDSMKVPLFDLNKKYLMLHPVPSMCLSERINWIISTIPHRISKILFVYGSYEFLAMLEGKIREAPFFKGSIW